MVNKPTGSCALQQQGRAALWGPQASKRGQASESASVAPSCGTAAGTPPQRPPKRTRSSNPTTALHAPPLQLHLVLDTSLAGDHVDVRAYASRALSLGDKALATEFVELPCEVLMGEAERVGRERPRAAGACGRLRCRAAAHGLQRHSWGPRIGVNVFACFGGCHPWHALAWSTSVGIRLKSSAKLRTPSPLNSQPACVWGPREGAAAGGRRGPGCEPRAPAAAAGHRAALRRGRRGEAWILCMWGTVFARRAVGFACA